VLDLPKQFFGVSSPAPQALLVKTWSEVQTDWYQEPWAGAIGEPAPPATADVSGITGQVGAWANSIALATGGVSTPVIGQAAGDIDISIVDGATLVAEFPEVIIAAQ
jgi:hypothetical protein